VTHVHIPSLPHTYPSREYDWCAYTAKVRRLEDMLCAENIDGTVYIPDAVDIVDPSTQEVFADWDVNSGRWQKWNAQCIRRIGERYNPGDLIGVIGGTCQQPIVDAFPEAKIVEWGIGYVGVLEHSYKVYESYTHRSFVQGWRQDDENWLHDVVIPNAFDPDDYIFESRPGEYLLYMGRLTPRKGVQIAIDTARETHLPLKVAGQGDLEQFDTHGVELDYHGVVTGETKARLLAGARAIMVPSLYLEPFGGVAVEAMMSGTPAITTDAGAFTETVQHGMGFRCSTVEDFYEAVQGAGELDRTQVCARARRAYSTAAIAPRYAAYFRRIEGI